MTHIANYPTKKAFKEAVATNPNKVYISDPSIFDPVSGPIMAVVEAKGTIYVTNHPKRSWYANVKQKNGKLVVS